MNNGDPLLTLPQLSRALRLSLAWLKAEATAGRIPSLRAGRRLLFSLEAVREALLRRAAGEFADRPGGA
ncbi:MAG: helix-turn-helix domain-containing protein [Planctomycetes bacterium]|nr:helix-turn-helix domain-containing protein [Planctomycetota bacterium]